MFQFEGGAIDTSKKTQFTSLLTLIEHQNKDLYNMINLLCLDGTFRSQRYQNTFLMPNKALTKKLEKLVEEDNDNDAIDQIKTLLLKGHLDKGDFKKDENVETSRFGSYVLAKPEEVGKKISKASKKVITTKKNAFATIVFDYDGDAVPEVKAGSSEKPYVKVGSKQGGAENNQVKELKDLTQSLVVKDNGEKTIQNYFHVVAAALAMLQNKDVDRFNRAKYYLAANPVLSWFFLTTPGRKDSLVKLSEIKDLSDWRMSNLDIIKEAESADGYKPNQEVLKKNKHCRAELMSKNSDKASLVPSINKAYEEWAKEANNKNSLDETLSNDIDLKVLMDELRFRLEDTVTDWSSIEDTISDLGMVDWTQPRKSKVVCDAATYGKSLKSVEAFMSGPVSFVKSIYFLYVPLTDSIEEQLEKAKSGGAIDGGNPSTISNIVFTGGAARKQLKKHSDKGIESFLKIISKDHRKKLLQALQSMD